MPRGDFSLDAGRVGNDGAPRYTYAGIAVMSPALVARRAPRRQGAARAAAAQRGGRAAAVPASCFDGLWQDVGTAERLAELETQLASRK